MLTTKCRLAGLIALICAFFTVSASTSYSQLKEGQTVDKIIAVVGNEIIMMSDLNSQLAIFAQQDPSIDMNDKELRKKVLDAMINEKLVVTKAIEDSIVATDEEIKQRWDYQLQNLVKHYGSEKRIEDIYGMSISRMEYEYKDDIRKQILAEKIRQQKFGEIKANPEEVDAFYKKFRDSLPAVPTQIELAHIVKFVTANKKVKEEIFELAKKVRDSIIKGGDFAEFAKRYSQDPGTAAAGGDLGWFEKGKLFPEFEKEAFDISIGQISQPVETPFGYHIIQTINKNKDSVLTRHILFKFGQSDDDKEKAKKELAELKERIIKGEKFDELAKKYSEEKETQGFGGTLGKFPINQIPASLKEIIDVIPNGGISEPLLYTSEPKVSFHIIYKKRIVPEHKPTIEEDYKELEQYASSEKQKKLYIDWVEDLRKTMYWEIKE